MFVVQRRTAIIMMMRLIQPWHNTSTPLWYSTGFIFVRTAIVEGFFVVHFIELIFSDFVLDNLFYSYFFQACLYTCNLFSYYSGGFIRFFMIFWTQILKNN